MAEANLQVVGVMGDTHGDTQWTTAAIRRLSEQGVNRILHLGDFGVWPGLSGEKYLRRVESALAETDSLLIVTLGNHENYDRLDRGLIPATLDPAFQQLPGYDHILFAARGQHWNWDGVEFCSLGGANSIDRYSRTPHMSWWPQESITMGDVYRTMEAGSADIMLTHDCPEGVPILAELTHHSEDAGWSMEALSYAQESRLMLRQAVDVVKPELLLHGHYHVYADLQVELGVLGADEGYELRSVCLSEEHTATNIALLYPHSRIVVVERDWHLLV